MSDPALATEAHVSNAYNGPNHLHGSASSGMVQDETDQTSDRRRIISSQAQDLNSSYSSSANDLPSLAERQGDVISSHEALLTLAKGFVGTGCLSLPYAWKLGGLWMSFFLQFIISGLNWYSNHILAKSAQYLAARSDRPSLDYGHFAKKVFDFSGLEYLQKHSRKSMYVVNITVLLYQLGCSSVPLVFIGANMSKIIFTYFNVTLTTTVCATLMLIPLLLTNMLATIRAISYLAIAATLLWLFGALAMIQQCFRTPNRWNQLPGYTNLWSTVMFFGTAMYSYEGQTMILPVENKMRYPEEFTANWGVLPTLMILVTVLYTSIGFYGYTAFGDDTLGTLTLNMPQSTLFTIVTIMLMLMAFLAHPINLYVVFDMFWPGFKRKFPNKFTYWKERIGTLDVLFRIFWVLITYFIAVFVPRIEQIVSLVGITGGSLCAFVYPPIFEILTFRTVWALNPNAGYMLFKISFNIFLIILGLLLCILGLYVNIIEIYESL